MEKALKPSVIQPYLIKIFRYTSTAPALLAVATILRPLPCAILLHYVQAVYSFSSTRTLL